MKRGYFKSIVLFLVATTICLIDRINADAEEDSWMDPDAWARDRLSLDSLGEIGKCCKCSDNIAPHGNSEEPLNTHQNIAGDAASIIYFRKFITMLFNRKYLKYDSTSKVYKRSIVLTVDSSQLDKLEQLQDPRDLDNILAHIFDNVRTPNMYTDGHCQMHTSEASSGFGTIILQILYDVWKLSKTSEIRFLLVVVLVIIIAWIVHHRFNISWVPLIFGGIFLYGYLHTYLECNREKEVNQLLEVLNRDEKEINNYKFVKFLKGIFYSDDKQDLQHQKLKQSAKLSLAFCRPDHVLIKYFNDIFLTYMQVLLEQCAATLTSLNTSLGFPYNILSGFMLICVIAYILNLTFKYILNPSVWLQFRHRKHSYHPEQASIRNNSNSQGDRISGDNLKMLLNAIANPTQRTVVVATSHQIVGAVSGVEEVKEAIEAPPKNNSPQLNTEAIVEKQNNNNSNDLEEKTNIKLEDLCEDS